MAERTWKVLLRNPAAKLLAASAALIGLGCGGDDVIAPTFGTLEITTVTSGPEPDPDGYAVTIDAGAEASIALNGTHRSDGLEPGNHTVQLTGLAANCTVAGDNPRTVSVAAGATASVEFTITCGPTTGSLTITVSTSGPSPDADGYSITVDGGDKGPMAASAEVTLTGLAPGDHQVGLSGIAANCQAQGDNPRMVTIVAGATSTAAFIITCTAPPPTAGSLTITTTTTGTTPDPDGYSVALDEDAAQSIGLNATVTLTNVAAGAHAVRLSGVAANCRAQGTNPRSVTLVAGATATISFSVSCSSIGVTHWTSIRLGEGGEFHWTDLWGSSPTDLFVTGSRDNVSVIWHFNGQSWSEQLRRNDIGIIWIWGSSPTDVFAVSEGIYPVPGVILHYNGTSWSEMAGPVPGGNYWAVWGNSGSDVYASPGVHYDGRSWTWMPEREAAPNDFGRPYIVAGSFGDLYAFGSRDTSDPDDDCNNCTAHYILHHDGTTWTETFTTGDREENFHAIWVSGRNDAWVAVQELPYKFYHFDGTGWVGHVPYREMQTLDDIWGSSPSNLYAVGFAGIVHYDGISWKQIKDSEGRRVWGTSPTDVFVLGENAVLHGTP